MNIETLDIIQIMIRVSERIDVVMGIKYQERNVMIITLIQVMDVVQPVKLKLVGLVMVEMQMIHMINEFIATIAKVCIKTMQIIQHYECLSEVMEKEQMMKSVTMAILYQMMAVNKIDHELKIHGSDLEELKQQKTYVNIVILLLVGIQMMNLFQIHAYQDEMIVKE